MLRLEIFTILNYLQDFGFGHLLHINYFEKLVNICGKLLVFLGTQRNPAGSVQSYKRFTIVIYDSRVVPCAILLSVRH